MKCFECWRVEARNEAVAQCHHCSAALCYEHARVVNDPIQTIYPVAKTVVLPIPARMILCDTCKAALSQQHTQVTFTELHPA